VLAATGLSFIVFHLCFETIVMTSDSMAPTLCGTNYKSGDRILVEKVTSWFRAPKRWEIHYFHDDEGMAVAKRIVALPGETIGIKQKSIWINGSKLEMPRELAHLKYHSFGNIAADRQVKCDGGYYMLGDDSRDSYDSRFTGPISPDRFRGRVWCILWPLSRASFVN
jgi:signal peptidase I